MSYLDWKVGDQVVCVEDGPINSGHGLDPTGLVRGCIYTIRWIGEYYFGAISETKVAVRLNEYVRDPFDSPVGARRFRKVQPRKTDISIFQRILDNPKVKIPEDA